MNDNANRYPLIISLGAFGVALLVNALRLGGDSFVALFNNFFLAALCLFGAFQSAVYWKTTSNRMEANRVWFVFSAAFLLYFCAQLVWIYYGFTGNLAPYPSQADLFWVFSYPLFFVALLNKNLLIGIKPDKTQIAIILTTILILFSLALNFVLIPIANAADFSRIIETILAFLYPISDILTLAAAGFLITILWKGRLALTWNIIAAGFLVLGLADILFIYTNWNGLYYPDGIATPLTLSIDLGYNLGFVIIILGIYLNQWAVIAAPQKSEFDFLSVLPVEKPALEVLPLTPNVQEIFKNMFLMVDQQQAVFYLSSGYQNLCNLAGVPTPQLGQPLHHTLGLDIPIFTDLLSEMGENRRMAKPAELLMGRYRIPVSISMLRTQKGGDVFIKYAQENELAVEDQTPIATLIVDEILKTTKGMEGVSQQTREITAFFLIEVQELYIFLVQMGGVRLGQVLIEKFNRMAVDKGVSVQLNDGRVVLKNAIDTNVMFSLLGVTIKTVRELTSVEATSEIIKQLNAKIPERIIQSAQNAGLAL